MHHRHPVRTGCSGCFGSSDGINSVLVIYGFEVWIQLLLLDPSQDLPCVTKVFVVSNGSELFIKTYCDCSLLGVGFSVFKGDGLIRRAKDSFARHPADKIRKLCRVSLRVAGFQLFLKGGVGGIVTRCPKKRL